MNSNTVALHRGYLSPVKIERIDSFTGVSLPRATYAKGFHSRGCTASATFQRALLLVCAMTSLSVVHLTLSYSIRR